MPYLLVYYGPHLQVDFFWDISLRLRVTLRVNFFGAQLLVITPMHPRDLPFVKASVPAWPLLELYPCSASKPLKAPSPLSWSEPMLFLAAVPSGISIE